MDSEEENQGVAELAQSTLEANEEHRHALETHIQTLEAELEKLDKLIDVVDTFDESDLDVGCSVIIPGSVRAIAPIATKELLLPESPFHEDAMKRNRYLSVTHVRSMKSKELEALSEAVRAENCRRRALDIQKRGSSASLGSAKTTHNLGLSDEGIDWNRVAEKVSAVSMTPRTAKECEIRWLGEQNPEFSHEPWTQEEVQNVKSLAADFEGNHPDWVTIAERLGTRRTPLDCMRHGISRKSHHWTAEADERLLEAVRTYGHENWHLVARHVSEDVTPSQCSNRFQKTLDPSIRRTAWTSGEDARLSAAVAAYGSSWVDVAANVPGRHNDQCRERWTEHLGPGINKSRWAEDEDRALVDYMRENKNASWRQVSEHLHNGRTETMCRNRYAVLQRGAPVHSEIQSGPADEAKSSNIGSIGSGTIRFKSPKTSAAPDAEWSCPNQFVFLEPAVSSNAESHKHHRPRPSQYRTRFKTIIASDVSPSTTMPPSKKRKTHSHSARSSNPTETRQGEPAS